MNIKNLSTHDMIKICKVDNVGGELPVFPLGEGDYSVCWENMKLYLIKSFESFYYYYELDEKTRKQIYDFNELVIDNDVIKLKVWE